MGVFPAENQRLGFACPKVLVRRVEINIFESQ
jgi:hypothetical protein